MNVYRGGSAHNLSPGRTTQNATASFLFHYITTYRRSRISGVRRMAAAFGLARRSRVGLLRNPWSDPRLRWHSCAIVAPSVGVASSAAVAGILRRRREVRLIRRKQVWAALDVVKASLRVSQTIANLGRRRMRSVWIEAVFHC